MTRLANPKSKTEQIVLIPKNEWMVKIRAFKEICARNGLSMSEMLFTKGVETFLKEHNWPPGNSQTLLFNRKKPHPSDCRFWRSRPKAQPPYKAYCGKFKRMVVEASCCDLWKGT